MAGLCGVVGDERGGIDDLAVGIDWSGAERHTTFEADGVTVRSALLPDETRDPPATSGTTHLWLWGNVYGFDGPGGYTTVPADAERARKHCANLCDEHGVEAVTRLNGDFFGVVYDDEKRTVSFVTDRLGTRDVYYTVTPDGTLVFSSRIQSLPRHHAVTPSFHREFLYEYFMFHRAFGTRTPIQDVEMFPPGAVTTYAIPHGTLQTSHYWRPQYRPLDRPYSHFVDTFVDLFQTAVEERVPRDQRGALLLSGGSDSRLLLATLKDHNVTAYHLANWMSREARTAERVALATDTEFELLRRDDQYFAGLLRSTPAKNNFVQVATQAHAQGFIDDLRRDHEYVLTNHLADVLFKLLVPTRSLSLGRLGSIRLPRERRINTFEEFLSYTATSRTAVPTYVTDRPDIDEVLSEHITRDGSGYRHHGVRFATFDDLVTYRRAWPGTSGTDTFFRRSLHENLTHHIPLLDTRILDFWQTIPKKYLVRHDLVNSAIEAIAPELAKIPHADTGVPLHRPFPLNVFEAHAIKAVRKFSPLGDDPPSPILGHGPWGNSSALIRNQGFIEEIFHENEEVLDRLPFLDRDKAFESYRAHCAGANRTRELLTLASFLGMPVTRDVVLSNH